MGTSLRIVAVVGLVVAHAACSSSSSSPSTPSPAAPAPIALEGSFHGVWQVTSTVTQCAGLRHCFAQVGRSVDASLRIFHVGDTVEGTAVIGDKWFDVRGTASADSLRLTGHQDAFGGCVGEATLTSFELTRLGTQWTGQFAWTSVKPSTCAPSTEYQSAQDATLVTAVRAATQVSVPSFTGTWAGAGTTVSCSPDDVVKLCYSNTGCVDLERRPLTVVCESGTQHPFGVGLTQMGQDVSGTLQGVPVSGRAVNGRVTLSGTRTTEIASLEPGTHVETISMASFVLDHLGRMTGTYRVDREYFPKNGLPPSRWSHDERLDSVVVR